MERWPETLDFRCPRRRPQRTDTHHLCRRRPDTRSRPRLVIGSLGSRLRPPLIRTLGRYRHFQRRRPHQRVPGHHPWAGRRSQRLRSSSYRHRRTFHLAASPIPRRTLGDFCQWKKKTARPGESDQPSCSHLRRSHRHRRLNGRLIMGQRIPHSSGRPPRRFLR